MDTGKVKLFLERIGIDQVEEPTLAFLRHIHQSHAATIPVENLDVVEGHLPLSLNVDDLFDKIVTRHRGGLSFEISVLLHDVLNSLGYDARLMSACHPRYGKDTDHAFLMVKTVDDESLWLVDVGYTEAPSAPLLFDQRVWQSDGHDSFTFAPLCDDRWNLMRRHKGEESLIYTFTTEERQVEDLKQQFDWFCTNSASRFTQGPFVSVDRADGRVTLSIDTVTNTYTEQQLRPVITTEEELHAVLREIFGIELDAQNGDLTTKRILAALGDDELDDAIIRAAVKRALDEASHLRFAHLVCDSDARGENTSFPDFVAQTRARMQEKLSETIASIPGSEDLFGGELLIMGINNFVQIDEARGYAPNKLVESVIKPFDPHVVICGEKAEKGWSLFRRKSTAEYLRAKLDCEIQAVSL